MIKSDFMKRLLPLFLILFLLPGCSAPKLNIETTGPHTAAPSTAPFTAVTEPVAKPAIPEPSQAETTPSATSAADSPQELSAAEILLNHMTTEELVGQLFFSRCPVENAVEDIRTYHLGGYILFGRDFEGETPDSIRQTLAAYQSAASVPMLIGVDEEGGIVTRISHRPAFRDEAFPSLAHAYAAGGTEEIIHTETEKCKLLRYLGINEI